MLIIIKKVLALRTKLQNRSPVYHHLKVICYTPAPCTMSSSIGKRLVLTSFGESHGKCIGTVLDGCPAGLKLDERDLQPMLNWRRPGQSSLPRREKRGMLQRLSQALSKAERLVHPQCSYGIKTRIQIHTKT